MDAKVVNGESNEFGYVQRFLTNEERRSGSRAGIIRGIEPYYIMEDTKKPCRRAVGTIRTEQIETGPGACDIQGLRKYWEYWDLKARIRFRPRI
jgi:hypothetical protein